MAAKVLAGVLGQDHRGCSVAGAVSVGGEWLDLILIVSAAGEHEGEAEETGRGSCEAKDRRERVLHETPK
jgi:hypothetical protein